MTIIYENNPFPPEPFGSELDYMEFFRDLYEGNHAEIFPRAKTIGNETSIDKAAINRAKYRYLRDLKKKHAEKNAVNHYVVINFASAIAELPADLINRSLGNISADEEDSKEYLEFISQIAKTSKVKSNLWSAIVQQQVDGAIAYRIRRNKRRGTWFEWLLADLYFEHDDEFGADIAWTEDREDETFLRVERQRLVDGGLELTQHVFEMKGSSIKYEKDFREYASLYGILEEPSLLVSDLDELMCGIVTNDETLRHTRGRSGLRNIVEMQEEINWTITRDSVVFEKHGKPKLAIPRQLWDSVANKNNQNYGGRFVRNADLEVVSYDESKGAIPMYITWNAQTEQSFKHVARLIDYIMATSKTAATAVGLGSAGGTLSAKAILYEWIQSVIKAEAIRDKFDETLKDALRKCVLLENAISASDYEAKDPVIEWKDMLPKAEAETGEEESKKYADGVQSLETTVRNIHPDWSEKAIAEEVEKIQNEKAVDTLNPTFTQPPRTTIGDDEQ
ncbi:phage portal protein [Jeotgalibacillus sp. ET6]|uniref:phage portal protein n=1 Tax=Jeotgalibacillus sp. ET6 TaxID=3037260 RepID=UPI0024181BAA|nr:phage portal protein [Jeotgalibacillus sp. ET6]MDG5470522.1 phage portal protein [Jeotgalibacillus sp. ET6]